MTIVSAATLFALSISAPALAADAPMAAVGTASIATFIAEAAHRFAIPETWIYAVMRVESAGNPRAVSSKGAAGLMQIMPSTWTKLRIRYGLGDDICDAHDNIIAGAGYLREMYDRYGSPGFLAAYNAGPGRYEDYLNRRRPLPDETIAYVDKLAPATGDGSERAMAFARPDPMAWTRATLFIGSSDSAVAETKGQPISAAPLPAVDAGRAASAMARDSLFPPLSGHPSR